MAASIGRYGLPNGRYRTCDPTALFERRPSDDDLSLIHATAMTFTMQDAQAPRRPHWRPHPSRRPPNRPIRTPIELTCWQRMHGLH